MKLVAKGGVATQPNEPAQTPLNALGDPGLLTVAVQTNGVGYHQSVQIEEVVEVAKALQGNKKIEEVVQLNKSARHLSVRELLGLKLGKMQAKEKIQRRAPTKLVPNRDSVQQQEENRRRRVKYAQRWERIQELRKKSMRKKRETEFSCSNEHDRKYLWITPTKLVPGCDSMEQQEYNQECRDQHAHGCEPIQELRKSSIQKSAIIKSEDELGRFTPIHETIEDLLDAVTGESKQALFPTKLVPGRDSMEQLEYNQGYLGQYAHECERIQELSKSSIQKSALIKAEEELGRSTHIDETIEY